MNKAIIIILTIFLSFNLYYTNKLFKFAKASENYFKKIELKTECLLQMQGADRNDIYLAARGRTRKDLKGKDREILPSRDIYDTQIPECKEYFGYHRCWYMDTKDPKSVEACHSHFWTDQQYKIFKQTGKTPWDDK